MNPLDLCAFLESSNNPGGTYFVKGRHGLIGAAVDETAEMVTDSIVMVFTKGGIVIMS